MNNIRAVILAAGESSRFYPLSNGIHKSMIKIMGKPILQFTIESLKESGISDLIIVTNGKNGISDYFGDGKKMGVRIKYVVQKNPEGMGEAILLCKDYIAKEFIFLNASHVDIKDFVKDLSRAKQNAKAVLLGKRRETKINEGVLKFSGKKVLEIIEKPTETDASSEMHVVGIYLFERDFLDTLAKTKKEHYSLEKAISSYANKNEVIFVETQKETVSLKYPWDLLELKSYLFKDIVRSISKNSKIAKSAEIIGEVFIEDGVEIMEGARVKGPCFIGKNVKIGNNALLRGGSDIEKNSMVGAYMEIKNTILMENSTTHSGFIGDSIIGSNCKIAAQFCTANVRFDRETIKAKVKNTEIDTNRKYLGVIVGENANIGIKSSTMPGVIIGRNVLIGPSTVVLRNVEDGTKYYTKFQEIVSKRKTIKPIVLFDIDYTLFDTDHFKKTKLLKHKIYDEVIGVLDNLSKIATLGIFSEGNLDFQKEKLRKTDIKKYFDEINTHIVLDKLSEIKRVFIKYKNKKLFLVDDKLSVLYKVWKILPTASTIWVKRGIFAKEQKEIPGFRPTSEILNLKDVVKIIQSKIS